MGCELQVFGAEKLNSRKGSCNQRARCGIVRSERIQPQNPVCVSGGFDSVSGGKIVTNNQIGFKLSSKRFFDDEQRVR